MTRIELSTQTTIKVKEEVTEIKTHLPFIKLTEIVSGHCTTNYKDTEREIIINTNHIVCMNK